MRIAAFIAMLLVSCSHPEFDALRTENIVLKQRVAELERELDSIKNGPARVLAGARASFDSGRLDEAKAGAERLLKSSPAVAEAADAKLLLEQIAARQAEDAARVKTATASLVQDTDKVRGITWFKHKSGRVLQWHLKLYFGRSEEGALMPLRIKAQFVGEDWLFVNRITVKADDRKFSALAGTWERDNGAGTVWEWIDLPTDEDLREMVSAIIAAKDVVVRFEGDKYYSDKSVPQAMKDELRDVLLAYSALSSKPSSAEASK